MDEAIGKGPSPPGWLLYGTQALLSLLAVVLAEALSVWWLQDLGRPSSGALTWALIVYSVLAVVGGLSLELIVDPDVPTSRRLGSAFWWFVLVLLLWLAVTVESSMISEFFSISFFLVLWSIMVLALILGCIAWLFLALWLDEEW